MREIREMIGAIRHASMRRKAPSFLDKLAKCASREKSSFVNGSIWDEIDSDSRSSSPVETNGLNVQSPFYIFHSYYSKSKPGISKFCYAVFLSQFCLCHILCNQVVHFEVNMPVKRNNPFRLKEAKRIDNTEKTG